ncbi:crooked neck-like protein 1 [Tanacetum coccineum]
MANREGDPNLGYLTRKETEVKLPRPTRVKNKTPAPVQITAEQILREARERQEAEIRPPKQKITDPTELADYRLRKRKEFEDLIRRVRWNKSVWVKYAKWEESQKDFNRARSVWERALDVDYRDHTMWLKYADVEMKNKFIQHARNVWDRAVTLLPRVDQLWYKYIHMEEMLGNVAGVVKIFAVNCQRNVRQSFLLHIVKIGDILIIRYMFNFRSSILLLCRGILAVLSHLITANVCSLSSVPLEIGARQIFERWMSWEPDQQAWLSYIKFELRYNEIERARAIYERFMQCLPKVGAWIRFAKFEMKNGEIARARNCYERAVDKLADDEEAETLFVAFAEFEEKCKETERARCIYKFALDHIPKGRAEDLYRKFVAFEKQYGDREGIEDAIVGKRRFQYEEEVRKNPLNYDSWFDYVRLEESVGNKQRIREVYERAIANVPPADEKRYWQRYIYLWINYALYEELDAQDVPRTRDVYSECLKLIPHKKFSFAKVWLLAAQFEIRQLNLSGARAVLGNAIGIAPKDKIFKKYIEIELQLGNMDRCRKLYEKYLEWSPENCYAWSKYAELERSLMETERARAIFELAIAQPALDMPELLWKAYIDFEIAEGEFERTRQLYERLLDRTKHLKVWISYAKFEASAMEEVEQQEELPEDVLKEQRQQCIKNARRVFENAVSYYRTSAPELKEERAMLLEEWLNMESGFGELGDIELVRVKLPKKLKKRRQIEIDDGPAGYEEYIDYLFPEESQASNLKILEQAYKWKKQKVAYDDEDDDNDDEDDDDDDMDD